MFKTLFCNAFALFTDEFCESNAATFSNKIFCKLAKGVFKASAAPLAFSILASANSTAAANSSVPLVVPSKALFIASI